MRWEEKSEDQSRISLEKLRSPHSTSSLHRCSNQDQRKEVKNIFKSKESFTYLIIKMNKDLKARGIKRKI